MNILLFFAVFILFILTTFVGMLLGHMIALPKFFLKNRISKEIKYVASAYMVLFLGTTLVIFLTIFLWR